MNIAPPPPPPPNYRVCYATANNTLRVLPRTLPLTLKKTITPIACQESTQ